MDQGPQVASPAISPSRALALIRRVASPIWLRVGVAAVLEVPDRRTGTPRKITLIPWEVDGNLYLMSQYGVTDWVRNLRGAGRCELRRKRRSEAFTAIEVDGTERDRVITVFHARTPKPFRRDFEQRPAAAEHPTFRLEPSPAGDIDLATR
jgi:deazaflavin-dependent oxidoreductase (nitroreductase family)